ncbi:unannotated protein [freshwater metagenome]|uniref:Unannotated protein n=1 Tax=freshwater metagenome TaxID=449393 RepID=A0A6J7I3A6_9ZZZZ|nr:cellulase family glycosylhydrolase [Actinomycetota bacterium]
MRIPFIALLLAAALACGAGAATASTDLQVGIADDGVTQRAPELAPQMIPQWKAAGIDVARILVIWSYVAPDTMRMTAPAGFDPSNPADPRYNWAPIDQAVTLLRQQGIEPILNITGWGPVWGSLDPARRDQRYRPDPEQFAAFAGAVAQRYAGRVNRYILWNEPNLQQWLKPSYDCRRGYCTPSAPHQYRHIALRAIPAIKAADPGASVYGPALASKGDTPSRSSSRVRPLTFLRALGCVTSTMRPDRSSKNCRGFRPVSLDGIAYHPHSTVSTPTKGYPNKDDANLADYGRLMRTVDGVQRAGGLLNGGSASKRFDFFFDEFGYQTNPPDPYLGVTLARQSAWLQQAAYIAYKRPRVRMLVQYLWRDDPVRSTGIGVQDYSGWQSGLTFFDGRPKPALATFRNPFWVDRARGSRVATVWGQVRPGGASTVTVERARRTGAFTTLRVVTTDPSGYFRFTAPVTATTRMRFRYRTPTGATATSATVIVTPVKRGTTR